MITRAALGSQGVTVRFADDKEGFLPLEALELGAEPREVRLPSPYLLEIYLQDGRREELPWDYVRAFVEPEYRLRAQEEARRGKRVLGERLRKLRAAAGLSQGSLANRAGISRVTLARLEAGEQDPHYETLLALARGLGLPLERLLVD